MRLSSLKVHGFKSFADATEVAFHDGVTAIVGPNGCGKSNISDAIRWVLGEQRPTAIRGAKMEEAIFQGSVHRRPVNRGSVTMTVTNEDGALPVPFEEVEIGRIVYRDGGSDYSINRSMVRLKDVVDLTRDTGLGAGANVIENRMIDSILSDRAEERRSLFEEAAGIGKYKDRRKSALRRLERAENDLQRLDDVIAEVESKVRSLARQKGKAERYLGLRDRRLDVEVAVVRSQLDTLGGRLREVTRMLEGETPEGEGMVAEVQAAESEYEALRLRQVDAQRERGSAAARLDEVRTALIRWERDLAVADERASYARRRLSQIDQERSTARERAEELAVEVATLREDGGAVREELDGLAGKLQERKGATDAVRARLQTVREELQQFESREREVARRGAQLEGDAESADAQAAELDRRLERLSREIEETADALSDLASQGDLFSGKLDEIRRTTEAARQAMESARSQVDEARSALEVSRAAEVEAGDRAATLDARRGALEALERDREGMEPVLQAVLDADIEGVHGPLVGFVGADRGVVRAVEAWLGPLARALVVENRSVARRVAGWFRDQWTRGGGVILLPLDAVPAGSGSGSLLAAVRAEGKGAPWVEALLAGVELVDDEALLGGEGPGVTAEGTVREASGVVRVGNPTGGAGGLLERKEELARLEVETTEARSHAAEARTAREAARLALTERESALEEARTAFRAAEDTFRKAEAEVAAAIDRRDRMDKHRDELSRQIEGTKAAVARAKERATQAREDRAGLEAEETALRTGRDEARARVEAVQEEWEAARGEQSSIEVQLTRLQGEVSRLEDRIQAMEQSRGAAMGRVSALDAEETRLGEELAQVTELQEKGADATEELFRQREAAEVDLRERDAALAQVAEALAAAEKKARVARQAEREATDRRHRLELERQELDGRIGRIQERLEGEWGRPLAELLEQARPVEGDPESLKEELRDIVQGLDRIGPVNMLAVEEHEEESARLAFLQEQHADLVTARNDLKTAIREINETATTLFHDTFQQIREHFKSVHQRLFEGGEADIWLSEEEDPLESPIEIHASPRGKKTQRIDLLSGGERALTALSLLFSIYLVKPSPFCVLDEVDAPLDENNIGRFIRLLHDFKKQTQFVVITHNPRTIEAADWIYGVTMEEPGVSTVVGVRLEDALEQARGAA
ncbi:chromosome segregation protein SMC [Gaopeijia maritima]|uniref:Chromosome partition protein Smc n=1 Tax=Gaopeijia maritima TaxID=3119007 RepID=A0ABU9EDW0_9BACT